MKYKIIILLLAGVVACAPSFAQVRTDINTRERSNSSDDVADDNSSSGGGNRAHDYSLGGGGGGTKIYGPLPNSRPQQAYIVGLDKDIAQGIYIGETVTFGYLESNGIIHSLNNFTSVDQHINFELGALLHVFYKDYYSNIVTRIISGFYGGTGVGIINNNLVKISNPNESIFIGNTGLDNPVIEKNSTAIYFPINAGYNLHLAKKVWILRGLTFNVNLLYAYTESKYIDGYDPPVKAAKSNDSYAILSAGLRFYITNYKRGEQ